MSNSDRSDGGPAFPVIHKLTSPFGVEQKVSGAPGMTLRDYFAAKAMQAAMSSEEAVRALTSGAQRHGVAPPAMVPLSAYAMADAMLKARSA